MPWRETTDPYRIWLAEVMLQQTTVATVIPYYTRFLEHFPTVHALAAAGVDDVLHLWQGLGYYRRAHGLHACARAVVEQHGGTFPSTEAELLRLPGIGPYTAAVVAATAFNQPSVVVDGNVERVMSRLFAVSLPLPKAKKLLRAKATLLALPALQTNSEFRAGEKRRPAEPIPNSELRIPNSESRYYANAIMELGATVCTPQKPQCGSCPVREFCTALREGNPASYPVKAEKQKIPHKHGRVYLITDSHGRLYLRQRPAEGLLGGLWEFPHDGWEENTPPLPATATARKVGTITHTFSHFKLSLDVFTAATATPHPPANSFGGGSLPPLSTLMKKTLRLLPPDT